MRIQQARDDYVEWLRTTQNLSGHTVRAYTGDINALERFVGSEETIDQLTPTTLTEFVRQQRAAGLGANSMRRRCSALSGFCSWLGESGRLAENPWLRVAIKIRRRRTLPRPVSTSGIQQLIRSLRDEAGGDANAIAISGQPHDWTTLIAVSLMISTGLRVGELVDVSCANVDLGGRAVRVLGKGQRERQVYLSNDWLIELVGAYIEARRALALTHDHLLFNRTGDPLTTAAMRARLAKAARRAGIAERITPHMLRHTAATQLIESGVDIRYVQRLLGHASLSTTELYTHVSDRALRHVVIEADVLGRSLTR